MAPSFFQIVNTNLSDFCYFLILLLFLSEVSFHRDSQADPELVSSGEPPTLTSQMARIAGVSHSAGESFSVLFC